MYAPQPGQVPVHSDEPIKQNIKREMDMLMQRYETKPPPADVGPKVDAVEQKLAQHKSIVAKGYFDLSPNPVGYQSRDGWRIFSEDKLEDSSASKALFEISEKPGTRDCFGNPMTNLLTNFVYQVKISVNGVQEVPYKIKRTETQKCRKATQQNVEFWALDGAKEFISGKITSNKDCNFSVRFDLTLVHFTRQRQKDLREGGAKGAIQTRQLQE